MDKGAGAERERQIRPPAEFAPLDRGERVIDHSPSLVPVTVVGRHVGELGSALRVDHRQLELADRHSVLEPRPCLDAPPEDSQGAALEEAGHAPIRAPRTMQLICPRGVQLHLMNAALGQNGAKERGRGADWGAVRQLVLRVGVRDDLGPVGEAPQVAGRESAPGL